MSPSLNRGFLEVTRNLATRHLAVSVICNQCGARMASPAGVETAEYGTGRCPIEGECNQQEASWPYRVPALPYVRLPQGLQNRIRKGKSAVLLKEGERCVHLWRLGPLSYRTSRPCVSLAEPTASNP